MAAQSCIDKNMNIKNEKERKKCNLKNIYIRSQIKEDLHGRLIQKLFTAIALQEGTAKFAKL